MPPLAFMHAEFVGGPRDGECHAMDIYPDALTFKTVERTKDKDGNPMTILSLTTYSKGRRSLRRVIYNHSTTLECAE